MAKSHELPQEGRGGGVGKWVQVTTHRWRKAGKRDETRVSHTAPQNISPDVKSPRPKSLPGEEPETQGAGAWPKSPAGKSRAQVRDAGLPQAMWLWSWGPGDLPGPAHVCLMAPTPSRLLGTEV